MPDLMRAGRTADSNTPVEDKVVYVKFRHETEFNIKVYIKLRHETELNIKVYI
jgi:hypothetical protein